MLTADGYVQTTDSHQGCVKTGGEWVSSLQIEDLITQCPGVSEAAVIGVKDDRWAEPMALVVKDPKSANNLTDTEIKMHLKVFADKGVISKYGIPEKILFVEKLRQPQQPVSRPDRPPSSDAVSSTRNKCRSKLRRLVSLPANLQI